MDQALSAAVGQVSEMVRASRQIVLLSGAGMSTSAGIPDFRGPDGLYRKLGIDNPERIFDIEAFERDPSFYYGFHREFLRGRVAIIFCPKLDADLDDYVERLAAILSRHEIRSITVLRMEVPCCTGTRAVVDRAIARSGKTIPIVEETISIQGEVL